MEQPRPARGHRLSLSSKLALRTGYGITFVPTTSRYVNNSNQGLRLDDSNFFSSVGKRPPVGVLRDPVPVGRRPPTSGIRRTRDSVGSGTLLRNGPSATASNGLNLSSNRSGNLLIDAAYSKQQRYCPARPYSGQLGHACSLGATLLQQV